MSKLKSLLTAKAKAINSSERLKQDVGRWLRGYDGKIVGFETPEGAYHIVFTAAKVTVREGDYPSCEARYRGTEDSVISVLDGKDGAYAGYTAGRFHFWGSLSEAIAFEKLVANIK